MSYGDRGCEQSRAAEHPAWAGVYFFRKYLYSRDLRFDLLCLPPQRTRKSTRVTRDFTVLLHGQN